MEVESKISGQSTCLSHEAAGYASAELITSSQRTWRHTLRKMPLMLLTGKSTSGLGGIPFGNGPELMVCITWPYAIRPPFAASLIMSAAIDGPLFASLMDCHHQLLHIIGPTIVSRPEQSAH